MKKLFITCFAVFFLSQYSKSQCTLSVNAGPDITTCQGAQIKLQVSATGATSYNWSPSAGLSSATVANPTAYPLTTTKYAVTAIDGKGCVGTDTISVTVKSAPIANAGPDAVYCVSDASKSFQLKGSAQNADSTAWVNWGDKGQIADYTSLNPFFTPDVNDTATTFYFELHAFTFPGCLSVDTVIIRRLLQPVVNAGPDQDLKDTTLVYLKGTVQNTKNFSWSGGISGNYTPDNTSLQPIYQASEEDLIRGNLNFVLNAAYLPGCPPASDTMQVKIRTGYSISGNIKQASSSVYGSVLLFRLENQKYTLLASTYFYEPAYNFYGLSNGSYLVLAQPGQDVNTFLPTYFGGDTSWTTAHSIVINNAVAPQADISLVPFVTADPNAFKGADAITGTVTAATDPNARTSKVNTIANATVYLLNASGKILAYTYSNESGHFSFSNLVEGQYTLIVDYAGAQIEYASAAVDGDPNTDTQSNFSLKDAVVTGVDVNSTTNMIQVFPNPAKDLLFVKNQEGTTQLLIYDLSGKVVLRSVLDANSTCIQVQDLPVGMYIAEFITANKITQQKFSKIQ